MPLDTPSERVHYSKTGGNRGIVIIGAGLAGLFTALKLSPLPVTVISPMPLGKGASSFWAQGGIAAAIGEGDHPEKHVADTIAVGGGIVDAEIASLVAHEAPDRILDLLSYGVPFDRDIQGKLNLSREAAHSERRIVRVRGDMAGGAIMEALISAVRKTDSISVMEGYRALELMTYDNRISGVTLTSYSEGGRVIGLGASAVVIASGGIGGLFAVTTNPSTSSGEGLGMAARAGALVADAEFLQFHPTAINVGLDPAPLATEALRGEGAVLINDIGYRFMVDCHPDAELAPRDIVARAVHDQVTSGRGAWLDCRAAIGRHFPDQYPAVYEKCILAGIDPVTSPIPVAPAAHYHMGGILTDRDGRTTIDGLWACGEVASTGMHGANRLASNSLLEAVVFASRIAGDIKKLDVGKSIVPGHTEILSEDINPPGTDSEALTELRGDMSRYLGVIRDETGLKILLDSIRLKQQSSVITKPFRNMLTAAGIVTIAALARQESRGGHYRRDWPETRDSFKFRSCYEYLENGNIRQKNLKLPENRKHFAE